jgi:hypothetical protein
MQLLSPLPADWTEARNDESGSDPGRGPIVNWTETARYYEEGHILFALPSP